MQALNLLPELRHVPSTSSTYRVRIYGCGINVYTKNIYYADSYSVKHPALRLHAYADMYSCRRATAISTELGGSGHHAVLMGSYFASGTAIDVLG